MSFLQGIKKRISSISIKTRILLGCVVLVIVGVILNILINRKPRVQYKTEKATKGTLVVTVTGSGQVSTANNATVSTYATGVISKLYVKDGDDVKTGDKIAEVELDLQGQQNAQQALSSYQSAKNNVEAAKANMYSLQSTMFSNWDTFMQIAQNGTYQYEDGSPNNINRALPEFHIANDNWLAAEAKYKAQQNVVTQSQIAMNAAWLSYQQTSPTIYAPISGVVSGFSLQVGSVIVASSNTTNSAQSATKIATIKTKALPTVSINLTEIDIPKIKLGNKATVTFDAFPDKTYTGQVVSIDSAGTVSSGVTSYPTVIRLDTDSALILPNMAASAYIITTTKHDVVLIPLSSLQKQSDGTQYVRIMKNGKLVVQPVEVGLSSDTQTEVISGLLEGDVVVTSIVSSSQSRTQNNQTQSPFSTFGVRGGFGGAGR